MSIIENKNANVRIWFDFENAPHVWVLKPLLDHFSRMGYTCFCSARDFSCTVQLLKLAGISAEIQAVREARSKAAKIINLVVRTAQLIRYYRKRRIKIAIGHGSRSQIVAARLLGIPVISLDDYEKSDQFLVRYTTRTLVPEAIDKSHWGRFRDRIVNYPGLKENIYMDGFRFDPMIRSRLGVDDKKIIVILRPETVTSHYYDSRSSRLLSSILNYLGYHNEKIEVILLPRNRRQGKELGTKLDSLRIKYLVPEPDRFGFEIVNAADVVIGGGGTMLREAACLDIPAFSYFAGQWGSVDDRLAATGRLVKIAREEDLQKIDLVKRKTAISACIPESRDFVISYIADYLERTG